MSGSILLFRIMYFTAGAVLFIKFVLRFFNRVRLLSDFRFHCFAAVLRYATRLQCFQDIQAKLSRRFDRHSLFSSVRERSVKSLLGSSFMRNSCCSGIRYQSTNISVELLSSNPKGRSSLENRRLFTILCLSSRR